ncbi:MAG TPA: lactate utilization protein [Symbiobacteriaceae bacterium]|jgi:L-lactate dehydrogenase complex protein LldG
MTTEKEFLAAVSSRLGRKEVISRPNWAPAKPLPTFGLTDPNALADRFAAELDLLKASVYRAGSAGEVAGIVISILQAAGLKGSVVRWADPTLEGLGLDEALTAGGYEVVPFTPGAEGLVQTAEQSVAGITGVDLAIAESGTIVLGSHRWGDAKAAGRGRVVSLLPPVHIALVRKEQLVYSSADFFRKLSASGPLPSQVIFASGPSRSADIENDLSIGVHGPGQEHVIVL